MNSFSKVSCDLIFNIISSLKPHKNKPRPVISRKINQKYAYVAYFNMLTKIW